MSSEFVPVYGKSHYKDYKDYISIIIRVMGLGAVVGYTAALVQCCNYYLKTLNYTV